MVAYSRAMVLSKVWRSILLASVLATTACASRQESWGPASTGQLSSADVGYCSPSYQAHFGWPDPVKAANVCACESRGNPRARSKTGRYLGLYQFSQATWNGVGGGDPYDPALNSEHAYRLFLRQGWRPWPVCGR